MENSNNTQLSQNMKWPGNIGTQKSKRRTKILYLLLAVFLVIGSAFGSFYISQNLNQASVPNAPESQPQAAAGKNQKTNNTEAEGCTKGCGSNEYCDNGRCRTIGGKADGRSDAEKAWDSVVIATPTPKGETSTTNKGYEAIPGYKCTAANCPSPDFECRGENICVNKKNPGLTVANDIWNCGGTGKWCMNVGEACIGGQCVKPENYKCGSSTCDFSKGFKCLSNQCVLNSVTSVTPTPIRPTISVPPAQVTARPASENPANCGGKGPCSPSQTCDDGVCKNAVLGAGECADIRPYNGDGAGATRECCVKNIGVNPYVTDANKMNPVDDTWHWTHCSPGTTCHQGVGCIGTATKTPGTTTTTTTTTVTVPPTITTTTTPSITTTVTITPTDTPTGTITVTPTPVSCNESCTEDSDCISGLYCDATSKKCRKSECSTETSCVCPTGTPEPTIVGCNKGCESDSNCMEGLVCDSNSGRCRRPSCMSSSDCRCQREITTTRRPTERETIVATRRPTTRQQETLTEAGILDLPGAITFGGGLILAIVGILLAL